MKRLILAALLIAAPVFAQFSRHSRENCAKTVSVIPAWDPGPMATDLDDRIDALAGSLGSNHDLCFSTPEDALRLNTFIQVHTAMNRADGISPALDTLLQVVERISRFGEDKNAFARILAV